jgi:hypothetical protein
MLPTLHTDPTPHATPTRGLTAADAIWIATAQLHQQHPEAPGFTPAAIQDQVVALHLTRALPKTVYQHIIQHVTATQPARPNRRRMLTDLGNGLRRLYIEGDDFHPSRRDSQTTPKPKDLPLDLQSLLAWYGTWSRSQSSTPATPPVDPLLALVGTWTFGHADEYLRKHRTGWEKRP